MTIQINHSSNRVDPPAFSIVGQRVSNPALIGGTGTYGGGNETEVVNTQEVVISGTDVTKREEIVFAGDITVTITPDTTYTANSYSNRSATDIVGATTVSNNAVGEKSETYYTTNGKDPVRTKANLYKGAFTVRRNLSGSDNFILKARTYCQGKWSPINKVELRIIRSNENNV